MDFIFPWKERYRYSLAPRTKSQYFPTTVKYPLYRDYFMVGECVRFLFTSCEGSLNERVSTANE